MTVAPRYTVEFFPGSQTLIPENKRFVKAVIRGYRNLQELNAAITKAANISTLESVEFEECLCPVKLGPLAKKAIKHLRLVGAGSDATLVDVPKSVEVVEVDGNFSHVGMNALNRLSCASVTGKNVAISATQLAANWKVIHIWESLAYGDEYSSFVVSKS